MLLALTLLTGGALLTLVLGVVGGGDPVAVLPLGAAFALLATLGFRWVLARGRRWWSAAYVLVGLVLASVVFALAPGVGGTLFLIVLVSQCVLLLPLPATIVVIAMVPMVHAGMPLVDGLREGLGTLVAVVFAAVVTELLRREQRDAPRARGRAASRSSTSPPPRSATGWPATSTTGSGTRSPSSRCSSRRRGRCWRDSGDPDEVLAKAQHQSQEALGEVRRSVGALREPRVVPPLGTALHDLAAESSAAGAPDVGARRRGRARDRRPRPLRRCSGRRRRG